MILFFIYKKIMKNTLLKWLVNTWFTWVLKILWICSLAILVASPILSSVMNNVYTNEDKSAIEERLAFQKEVDEQQAYYDQLEREIKYQEILDDLDRIWVHITDEQLNQSYDFIDTAIEQDTWFTTKDWIELLWCLMVALWIAYYKINSDEKK